MTGRATEAEQSDDTVLEAARKAAKLSYGGLGRVLGRSRMTAWRYCFGLRTPERGPDGPAERMEAWSQGRIHLGNFDKPAKPKRRKRGR